MNQDESIQKSILAGLLVLAAIAAVGWGVVLSRHATPRPKAPTAEVPKVFERADTYARTAKELKRRWIQCDLGDAAGLEPDAYLLDASFEGGMLYAYVHTEKGSALLKDDVGRPRFQVTWSDTPKAGQGRCTVHPPQHSHVVGAVPGAISGTVVSACADALADVDADGSFEIEVVLGHSCVLWFVGRNAEGEITARKRVRATGPSTRVEMILSPAVR